ncbi:MAG: flagellar biosynthesis regulator FlaF [Paracoccaceae bacterium]
MNIALHAKGAYSGVASPARTHSDVEYEALARITKRIRSSSEVDRSNFAALAEALHDNQKLWDTFACDVADKKNGLPDELKARIIYLAEFTRHHTSAILSKQADVGPLVEINTSIMRGLRMRGV